jgi:uncharacterized BrkB/YihY/UPF0761 family membrane protein
VMLWAYLLCISLLVGGELNAVLQDRRYLDGSMAGRTRSVDEEATDD